jgi:predicted TIM-barrel fold metal-dependent hydrolase
MWGYAAGTGLEAMRLICSGVFDKFPGLKIILGHMGEGIPFWLWRIDKHWIIDRKEGIPGTEWLVNNKLQKKPSQYFKDDFM